MVRLPWQKKSGDRSEEPAGTAAGDAAGDAAGTAPGDAAGEGDGNGGGPDDKSLVSCNCQDGTIAVYEGRVEIERTSRSKFDDKVIPMDEISGVGYSTGIVIGYIQIEQAGFENSDGGFLSSPVDENTLHFGHGVRDCAGEARDAILERAGGDAGVAFDAVD